MNRIWLSLILLSLTVTAGMGADRRLYGTWRTQIYKIQGQDHPLEGLMLFTPNYFVANTIFERGSSGLDANANSGPYRAEGGKLYISQWMQLHVRGDQSASQDENFLRRGVDETARYAFDGPDRLIIYFPSGNQYILERAQDSEELEKMEGLWAYETLQSRGGEPVPLTGMFLLQNGRFVQQSINDGEPFLSQLGQGHSGVYHWDGHRVEMQARVGLITTPDQENVFSSRANSAHQLWVEASPDQLTLTFGTGTIQRFNRVSGERYGEIFDLDRGALGLVGNHFVLVAETSQEAMAGSGRFKRDGTSIRFEISRWSSIQGDKVRYQKDGEIRATLTPTELAIEGGPTIRIVR